MRRIVLWALSTVTALVLLFGYHTSTSGPGQAVHASGPGPAPGSGIIPACPPKPSAAPVEGELDFAPTSAMTQIRRKLLT